MTDRATTDEREKFDHSNHPTDRSKSGDLHAPAGGKAENSRDSRGGIPQKDPLTPPDSVNRGASAWQSPPQNS
jgi:hypothetical protein